MARIRTIKPEFPQSESMGRVSREARYCFIMLWTMADDAGRLRAASRMLASLLFPYDDDAPDLIDGWLTELEAENCIVRYVVDGTTYLQITKWLEHQKIDKPSASKIPKFDDNSRSLAKPREGSPADLGPRTMDLGKDHSEANASGTQSAPDELPEVRLFRIGKEVLGKSAGGLITKIRRFAKGDDAEALRLIETAADKQDPAEWIGAVLRGDEARPMSMDEICPPEIYAGVH